MQKFSFKRMTAWLLALMMLVGVMPFGIIQPVFAGTAETAETVETVYVLSGSDFQEQPDDTTTKQNNVSAILDKVKVDYPTMNGLLFGGDYSSSTASSSDITALKTAVTDKYSNLADGNMVCIQGNHDPAGVTGLAASGNNDKYAYNDAYGVYVINEDDFPWNYDATEGGVKAVADDLEEYLQDKIDEKYSKPIFVVSHLPLHYTFRTPARGDGRYAKYIFEVLNDAGKQGLNIIFMFGHNHSEGYDTYLGGGAIFLKENDPIWIADPSSYTADPVEYTLNFTYLNCGYVGYSGDTADSTKTMTVFAITGDDVTIKRYSENGVYQLKSAGLDNRDSCTYGSTNYYEYQPEANTTTYDSPQTVTLKKFVTVKDEATGITATAHGITGIKVTKIETPQYDSDMYDAYASYDITLTGYTDGYTATVTIPAPADFVASKSAMVLYDGAVIEMDTNISDGITFTTNHFSVYDIAQYDDDAVVSAEGNLVSSYLEQAMTKEDLEEGVGYLIVPANGGSELTLTNQANGAGLLLEGTVSVDNTNLWYLDLGVNFANEFIRWGAPTGENNYLNVTNGGASVGGTGNRVTTFVAHGDGVFALGRNGVWLNRNSGGNSTKADGYGTDDGNSRWYFYKVVNGTGAAVTLQVAPNTVNMMPETTKNLAHAVLVDGEETSDYTITWTSSNTDVATVDNKGVVTGVADGNVTITATLTKANGQDVDGTVAVEITVNVTTKEIKSVTVNPMEGSVERGSKATTQTGSTMTITYKDGTSETIPVTVGMLKNADGTNVSTRANGTYENLTVTYAGQTVTGYTLNVTNIEGVDYPEYPDEGAVKVSKTAIYTEEKFRETGVAQVELSVSGVPSKKGVDLIVMLDTSSSINYDTDAGKVEDGPSRLSAIHASLRELVEVLKKPDANGEYLDVDIAIADFNDFTTLPGNDYFNAVGGRNPDGDTSDYAIFTGDGDLIPEAGDFESIEALDIEAVIEQVTTHNGTNYDYAFQTIYDLAAAKQAANEEDRDLYVIFMSDGAPYQYNYFTGNISAGTGYEDTWDHFLTGKLTDFDWENFVGEHPYFFNKDGNKHWMAEAIKGDPDQMYTVIREDAADYGLIDVTGDKTPDEYMTAVPGLGATMYTIGLGLFQDGVVEASTADWVIKNVASVDASGGPLYVSTYDADELIASFGNIAADIRYAAYNAYFVDQMGETFDLQMANTVTRKVDGETKTLEFTPKIEVKSYDIYTKAEADEDPEGTEGDTITNAMIGMRKGDYTVLETITFNENGTEAYSDKIGDGTNILSSGVINAQTFWYNTNTGVYADLDTDGDGTNDYKLAPETFYWKIGTVQESELAISYYVYLTDSLQGEREAGSYATNNFAILYYDNYLGNACKLETVSPMLAWREANVSYAFYLVDSQGRVVVNRATGETGSFANMIPVTRPIVYDTCKLNTKTELAAIEIAKTEGILPEGYKIYDENASYSIVVLSNQADKAIGWEINKADVATTYVTGFSTEEQFSNKSSVHDTDKGYDYTHTTVWFAVLWTPSTIPDQVVIDYGLPVDISVLDNDLFAAGAELNGVGKYEDKPTMAEGTNYTDTALINTFMATLDSTYGKAAINGAKVRYTPTNMQMNGYDKFAYEVKYTIKNNEGTEENQYYYGDVTVIPATIIYYEESFVTCTDANSNDGTYGVWATEGTAVAGVQQEDRPGKNSLAAIDHDNVYGYDDINASATKYSLGLAMKVAVNSEIGYHKDNSPTATFTFTGTGFDIISMTNSTSGAIFITATNTVTGKSTNKFVDNYYGYNYSETDGWTPAPSGSDAIYQVPVMKISGLDYGTYDVTIWVTYGEYFDHDGEEGYSFWLDSIRIYDPANDGKTDSDTVIEDAYKADGEAYPHYLKVKDAILDPSNYTGDTLPGIVFIDGIESTESVANYTNPGPNNEAYLAPAQAISFKLQANANPTDVQLGAKLANGERAEVQLTYTVGESTKTWVNTFETATDMYYSIMEYLTDTSSSDGLWMTGTITITNVSKDSNAIISLTNIKATFEADTVLRGGPAANQSTAASKSTPTISLLSTQTTTLSAAAVNTEAETAEPVEIAFLVDAEVIEDACAVMTALYALEPEVFVPEVLEYTVTPGLFGYNTINVVTSKDVASLTVNGIAAQNLSGSRTLGNILRQIVDFGKKLGINVSSDEYYIWTVSVKRADSYEIVAVNADGLASDSSVTDSNTSISKDDITNFFERSELFGIMEDLANRTFAPEYFDTFINERIDGRHEIITQTSEDVDYIVIDDQVVDHYITETVVDLGNNGEETVTRVWVAESDEAAENEGVEVNAYDEKGVGSDSRIAEHKFNFDFGSKKAASNESSDSVSQNSGKNESKLNFGKYKRM